jgi:glycosyltransferase involved in cell wall biosynthesis
MEKGLSFIVRIRNEEATLARSIRSLTCLTVPYEIILILHCCTDRSSEIAAELFNENPHVRIAVYDKSISRAGYETAVTDATSEHSFVTYSNWCMSKARYPWIFRWDADFVMTRPLLEYINIQEWTARPVRISLVARNGTHENREYYIHPSTIRTTKHVFWENTGFPEEMFAYHLPPSHHILHLSELDDIKPYWKESPWFETDDSPEAIQVKERYTKLVAEFGPEPCGMARASNPECNDIFYRITTANPEYVNLYA